MNQSQQINRLIKKGLFDHQLKRQRQKNELVKSLKITGLSLFILIGLLILVQLIPSASIEVLSNDKSSPEQTTRRFKQKINIFKSILPFNSDNENISNEVNILALGRPGKGYSGQNLTDTILLIHLGPEHPDSDRKAVLISLPRDLLVKTDYGRMTKINSLYYLSGIEGLKKKVEEITGLSIDHHILIDLAVAREIIELVDGLNVFVPQDIRDPYFPGPNYSYQAFNLAAGWRYLDGETALKYIRTRYTSPNGDFDRMARQQQIIQLLKQKVLALNPLWDLPTYLRIFQTLRSNIETDLSLLEIRSFYQASRKLNANQISSVVIDKKETSLLTGGMVNFGEQKASVVYPRAGQGNYDEIKNFIKQVISND